MKKPSDKSPRRTGAQLKAAIRRQPAVFAVYTILRLIVLATLVITANVIVDILYKIIDPRIKLK